MAANQPTCEGLPALQSMLDRLAAPACLWNLEGGIVAFNAAAQAVWQSDRSAGSPGFRAIRKSGGAAWNGWDPSEELGQQHFLAECRNGAEVEYLSFPAWIRNAAGRPEGVFETFLPLSVATVPRGIAHSLNNAFGVMLGNADLALMELSPEHELAENLREIRAAARQAREILRNGTALVPAPEQEIPPSRHRVLWIDDDEAFLLLASRALQRLGCEVKTFASPDDAFAHYVQDSRGWDLVAIDNNLLGREGLDVARQFLHHNSAQRLCIASGAVDEGLERRSRAAGVSQVISKPATVPEFAHSLRDLLDPTIRPPGPP